MKTPEMRIEVPDEHIRLMYHDGLTASEIANAIGCRSQWQVYGVLRRTPGGLTSLRKDEPGTVVEAYAPI